MEYRVWYRPYRFGDEEDFIDVEAENEQEARRLGAALGWVTSVELIR